MKDISEVILIEKAKKGNETAFSALMSKYVSQVYHVAYSILQNKEDAEDVSQETFLKIWKSLDFFRGDSRFSTWVFRIAKNTAIDFAAYRGRRDAVSFTYTDPETGELSESEPADTDLFSIPEQRIILEETQNEVREAMALLSQEHRLILTLREYDSLSYQEIGDRLGIDIGTVKSRISRAKKNLKLLLEERNIFPLPPSKESKENNDSI